MFDHIVDDILKDKAAKLQQAVIHTNRASKLGWPCERYLVYQRTIPPPAISVGLAFIFEAGDMIEAKAVRDLEDAGYDVNRQQLPLYDKAHNISGHLDGKIRHRKAAVRDPWAVLEVKSMAQWTWDGIKTLDDLLNHKQPWCRGYPAQLMIYMYLHGRDEIGILYLVNKQTHMPKVLRVEWDPDYTQGLLDRADSINRHVDADTLPDRIDYDHNICGWCDYKLECLPTIEGTDIIMLEDATLAKMLERHTELKDAAAQQKTNWQVIRDQIVPRFGDNDHGTVMIGTDWAVQGKRDARKAWRLKVQDMRTEVAEEVEQ